MNLLRPCCSTPPATTQDRPARVDERPGAQATALRRVHSAELLANDKVLEIEHGDAVYRLRLTSQGKLILTK